MKLRNGGVLLVKLCLITERDLCLIFKFALIFKEINFITHSCAGFAHLSPDLKLIQNFNVGSCSKLVFKKHKIFLYRENFNIIHKVLK